MRLLAVPSIDHEDEEADGDVSEEKDLGEMEQHKSVILHLLSQLKLGMDLTRVSHRQYADLLMSEKERGWGLCSQDFP